MMTAGELALCEVAVHARWSTSVNWLLLQLLTFAALRHSTDLTARNLVRSQSNSVYSCDNSSASDFKHAHAVVCDAYVHSCKHCLLASAKGSRCSTSSAASSLALL
jgi:hypothetical protein